MLSARLPGLARRLLPPRRVELALAAFVLLLIVQTPVAIFAYQYFDLSPSTGRALLLVKDAIAAGLLVVLAIGHLGQVRMRWFDWFAVAYAATVLVYAVVPMILGTELPLIAITVSVRQFLLPVELYAIGRLAIAAGADPYRVLRTLLVASIAAAAVTVALYLFVPVEFWQSTLDLVTFEREVQGLPGALSLWDIAVLGHYGVGESGQFARAIGPFTHPVGTANYFAVPLVILATAALVRVRNLLPPPVMYGGMLLLVAAVIAPIARGAWISVAIAMLLIAFLYRRPLPIVVGLAAAAIFIVLVPPFSYSVTSALSGTDSSVRGHQEAVEEGIGTAIDNPIGIGMGQGDHFGDALATEGGESASAGIGENLYLSLFVSVGPIGLAAFVAWVAGVGLSLWPGWRAARGAWARVAMGALLAGFLVAALSAAPLLRFTTAGTFWLLCGLFVPVITSAAIRGRADTRGAHTLADG